MNEVTSGGSSGRSRALRQVTEDSSYYYYPSHQNDILPTLRVNNNNNTDTSSSSIAPPPRTTAGGILQNEDSPQETKKEEEENNTTLQAITTTNNNNSTRSKNQKTKPNKPNLILHIGPSKTATTTIQTLLTQHKRMLLQNDNYEIAGYYKTMPPPSSSSSSSSSSRTSSNRNNKQKKTNQRRQQQGAEYIHSLLVAEKWNCWNHSSMMISSSLITSGSNASSSSTTEKESVVSGGGAPPPPDDDEDIIWGNTMMTVVRQQECWKQMTKRFDDIQETGKHIILSNEAMSHGYKRFMYYSSSGNRYYPREYGLYQLMALAKELNERFNVRIVACHRRYYEWLLSAFKEQNDKRLLLWSKKETPRDGGGPKWPTNDDGGKELYDSWSTIQYWMEHPKRIVHKHWYQSVDRSRDLYWGKAFGFDNFFIMDFHHPGYTNGSTTNSTSGDAGSGGNLSPTFNRTSTTTRNKSIFEHFICDIVPDATQTCNHIMAQQKQRLKELAEAASSLAPPQQQQQKQQRIIAERAYNARDIDTTIYDQIACEARKYLNNVTSGLPNNRNEASKAIREFLQQQQFNEFGGRRHPWHVLPLKCPTTFELQELLHLSLEKDRIVMGIQYARDYELDHVSKFWKTANEEKSFCSVDTVALFQNYPHNNNNETTSSWQEVLGSYLEKSISKGVTK